MLNYFFRTDMSYSQRSQSCGTQPFRERNMANIENMGQLKPVNIQVMREDTDESKSSSNHTEAMVRKIYNKYKNIR